MGLGMLVAVAWAIRQGQAGQDYPYNTFLFLPKARFSDFADNAVVASIQPCPYIDPFAVYLPFAWACLRAVSAPYYYFNLIGCFFVGLAGLFFFLTKALQSVVPNPWQRVFYSLSLLGTSYPVLLCLDRGNIEILVVMWLAGAMFLVSRTKYAMGMLFLLPALSFKLFPAFFLALLFRQRKLALIACCLFVFLDLTFLSLTFLSLPVSIAWKMYCRNMTFYTDNYVYQNFCLEGSASPWNAGKVCLIAAADLGWIAPIDFSYENSFVRTCYALYSGLMALFSVVIAVYICFIEKEFLRCGIALLLFISISVPAGADYRLLYAGVALVMLIVLKTRRPGDIAMLIMLALTMVPKKEIILPFAGETESGYFDVSIQVLLNPLLVLSALFLLLKDSRAHFDLRWSRLRFWRLVHAMIPALPAKTI